MNAAPIRHYCTYFDSNYLPRGLVLHQSLEKHSEGDFRLYVLCLDEQTEGVLKSLNKPTIVPISLKQVEAWDSDLLKVKSNRSTVEYYFTLSPILPLYVFEHFGCDIVTYLDSDLMFFSSPEAIFEELGNRFIFVTEHRFSTHIKNCEVYGRFNVQCQAFRKGKPGLDCLRRWRKQCLEWCYDRLEDGKFADQKYLDEWPESYGDALVISQHPGIGVAPWNVADMNLEVVGGELLVNGRKLVFFHFHGMKKIACRLIKTGLGQYGVSMNRELKRLYSSYMKSLREQERFLGISSMNSDKRKGHSKIKILLSGVRKHDLIWL